MGLLIGFINKNQKSKIIKKKKKKNLETKIKFLEKYELDIQGKKIKFIIDKSLKVNDPYMTADWLAEYILVSINENHPFWKKIKNNNDKKSTYIHMLAIDAFTQWRILKYTSPITPRTLTEIKDAVKREITFESLNL